MTPSIQTILILTMLSLLPGVTRGGGHNIPDTVKPGLKVSIVDTQGREIAGRVEEVSEHAVRVSRRGRSQELPIDQIVRIDRPDSVTNGALIGFGVGVGLGVIGGFTDPQGRNQRATFVPMSALGNGLICAALGTAIDVVVDKPRSLYRRGERMQVQLSPVIGRGVRAAALWFTW